MLKPIARHAERVRAEFERRLAAVGAELTVLETSPASPGTEQARRAVADGADLVVAAGGDGTVRAVATGLVGTGVPLGIVGLGTANLLAVNLGLPRQRAAQVTTALGGIDRRIDVGLAATRSADGDWSPDDCFLVMAGVGHDATTVQHTDTATKHRLGWLAYLWRGAGLLTGRPIPMWVRIDDGPVVRVPAWSVLVGNCGRLPGGIEVFPGARLDDGELDLLQARIANPAQWLPVAVSGVTGRSVPGAGLIRDRVREVLISPHIPTAVHVDGDLIGRAPAVRFRIAPAALTVRVPPPVRRRRLPGRSERATPRE